MKYASLFILFWFAIVSNIANARVVEIRLDDGITVTANYQAAQKGKPTIILLHPFLQTRNFSTVRELSRHLASNGIGILAPTLSLGISHRQHHLACEAIHTRSFNKDTQEIHTWIEWLQTNNIHNIIGAGYGLDAITMLTSASNYAPSSPFTSLLLFTLTYVSPDGGEKVDTRQLSLARQEQEQGLPDHLGRYKLSFCNRYIAPRDVYLSIAEWDQNRVLSLLPDLKIPVHVIIGSANTSLTKQNWPERLKESGVKIHYLEGVGRFYNGEHAYRLYQTIITIPEIFTPEESADDL